MVAVVSDMDWHVGTYGLRRHGVRVARWFTTPAGNDLPGAVDGDVGTRLVCIICKCAVSASDCSSSNVHRHGVDASHADTTDPDSDMPRYQSVFPTQMFSLRNDKLPNAPD